MERQPLLPEEKNALSDVATFNETLGRKGWRLENRFASELNLAGMVLDGASIANVEFQAVDMTGSTIRFTTFTNTDFPGCDLTDAVIQHVQFIDCDLSELTARGAKFEACVFRRCKGTNFRAAKASMLDCVFEKCQLTKLDLENAQLRKTRFEACTLDSLEIFDADVFELAFNGCEIIASTFSGLAGRLLTITDGSIQDTGFLESTFLELTLAKCKIKGLGLDEFDVKQMRITQCPSITSFKIVRSDLDEAAITQCPDVTNLVLFNSKADGLTITDSQVFLLNIMDSDITGPSVFKAATLTALQFTEARIDRLTVDSCTVDGPLKLQDTIFNQLSLREITYGQAIEFQEENTRYTGPDRFRKP